MSSNSFFEDIIVENPHIAQMKTQLRAMEHKRDNICIEIAIIQNLPNLWDMTMVDWDDPEISHLKEPYSQITGEISKLYWEIEELEAIILGEEDIYHARKTVYTFLDEIGHAKSLEYLQRIGMSTIALVDEVMRNPDFIKQTYKEATA